MKKNEDLDSYQREGLRIFNKIIHSNKEENEVKNALLSKKEKFVECFREAHSEFYRGTNFRDFISLDNILNNNLSFSGIEVKTSLSLSFQESLERKKLDFEKIRSKIEEHPKLMVDFKSISITIQEIQDKFLEDQKTKMIHLKSDKPVEDRDFFITTKDFYENYIEKKALTELENKIQHLNDRINNQENKKDSGLLNKIKYKFITKKA